MVLGALSRSSVLGEEVFLGYKAIEQDLLAEPYHCVDRFGEYKAPFHVAVKFARHCCEKFPRDVLREVRSRKKPCGAP